MPPVFAPATVQYGCRTTRRPRDFWTFCVRCLIWDADANHRPSMAGFAKMASLPFSAGIRENVSKIRRVLCYLCGSHIVRWRGAGDAGMDIGRGALV